MIIPGKEPPGRRTTDSPSGLDAERTARASMRSGLFAFFVDQFDIYLPLLVLASIASYFQPVGLSPSTTAVLSSMVFASTLIGRPLGAALFGDRADRRGRKHTTIVATTGFGCITLVIAMLPGSSVIGWWSIGLLIALRFVNGVFLGGAYTSAVSLAMEWSPPQRRGIVAGRILSAAPAAYATLGLLTLAIQHVLPSGDSYARFGWRIPFVIGAALAFTVVVVYRRTASEPETQRSQPESKRRPLVDLIFGPHRRDLLQVLVLMTGIWFANNMVSAVLPQMLGRRVGLTPEGVSLASTASAIGLVIAFQLYGALSQRIGRRRFYLGYGAVMAIVGSSLYAALMITTPDLPVVVIIVVALGLAANGGFGPIAAYLTERFPARIRASGFGVGYSVALVVPAFYGFYLAALSPVMPYYMTPLVFLVIAGILVCVGAALGPETKNVDMKK